MKLKILKISSGFDTGLIFIGVSFFSFSPVFTSHSKLLLAAFFCFGVISIGEATTRHFANQSLLRSIRKNRVTMFRFLVSTTVAALLLDGVVKALGKLWIYPDWSFIFYLFIFIPGFAVYWLTLAESYLAVKTVLDYFRKGKSNMNRYFAYEGFFFLVLLLLGVGFLLYVVFHVYFNFLQQTKPFFDALYVSDHSGLFAIAFVDVLLIFFGTWFIFEFIEYRLKKSSLIHDLLHGYYNPLVAVFASSWIVAVFMEGQNIPAQLWGYTNWPLSEIAIFGIPILVFVTWPIHYISFLSLFRIITDKQSEEVWSGDHL